MLGPVAPIRIIIVNILREQMSHRVLISSEKASVEIAIVSILHSGLRNPLVHMPTGTRVQMYLVCDSRGEVQENLSLSSSSTAASKSQICTWYTWCHIYTPNYGLVHVGIVKPYT